MMKIYQCSMSESMCICGNCDKDPSQIQCLWYVDCVDIGNHRFFRKYFIKHKEAFTFAAAHCKWYEDNSIEHLRDWKKPHNEKLLLRRQNNKDGFINKDGNLSYTLHSFACSLLDKQEESMP